MAIRHTIKTSTGLTAVDSIHRVKSVTIYRVVSESGDTHHVMGFVCASYADEKTQTTFQEIPHQCNVILNGQNFIEQAYTDLKSKPEFAGCTDC
jgi:hypothetical protein